MQSPAQAQRTQNSGFGARSGPRGGSSRPRTRNVVEKAAWRPVTNLGRLVKAGCINSIDEIFQHALNIKEVEIVDHFFAKEKFGDRNAEVSTQTKPVLLDDVIGISPVQKQSSSGQRTRFRALVIVGDCKRHVGFGIKCDKEVATAIRGAIIAAKLNLFPVRCGYWGSTIGNPHTVPFKVTGKCASVLSRFIPAPRGTGIVGSSVCKKVLAFAGVSDCFTNTSGHSRTTCNYVGAAIAALRKTYSVLTPNLWNTPAIQPHPFDVNAKVLLEAEKNSPVN